MATPRSYEAALGLLRPLLDHAAQDEGLQRILRVRESVLARYQPVFAPENIPHLTEQEFRDFLLIKNNGHWDGLHRQGPKICTDMAKLRAALAVLADESRPIKARLDHLRPKSGRPPIPGLSRAVITAILLITHPSTYGVWNNTSEQAMQKVGVWPVFEGESFGERYCAVNDVLLKLAEALRIDLWTLDSLWWRVKGSDDNGAGQKPDDAPEVDRVEGKTDQRFGLESFLQEFLRDNWEQIAHLGDTWDLLEEDGEVVGCEYATDVGRIDLLAHHKREPKWLVIELKREQATDKTVAQVLRYMGWVAQHRAKPGESVEGLIIARDEDPRVRYALRFTHGVQLRFYDVQFKFRDA